MNEVEKKALERYPYDYPERSGYIEGYKAALESVKGKVDEMITVINTFYGDEMQPFTQPYAYVLELIGKYIENQMSDE